MPSLTSPQIERLDSRDLHDLKHEVYRVDEFVQDAVSLRITPFMLDTYAHEYDDLVRMRDAHALELDNLRNNNRSLMAQV
jgi:ecotropic viral integration site 5 protein